MQVELGNANPKLAEGETRDAPVVTYVSIPDDPENFLYGPEDTEGSHHSYQQKVDPDFHGSDLESHLSDTLLNAEGITHLPGHEPVICVAHPFGVWRAHAKTGSKPTWVWSDNAEVQRILSEFYGCPSGRPADVEDTHYTFHQGYTFAPGDAPVEGVPYGSLPDLQANITQNGRDMQARLFGLATGLGGTATTAPTSTTATLDDQTAPGSTSQWNGQTIHIGSVWGNIISNTNATPPVLTVDRWYTPATPGGSAGSTPATGKYTITQIGAAVQFMGLSTSTTSLATPSTNTSLPSEIVTSGGGLVRQICPIAHTASTNITTLTPVYTANGSDSLPAPIGSVGTFSSMVVADVTQTMFFNTLLGSVATLASIGDQLTVTQTVTGT